MKLYQQLVLFMLAATILPLALVGFWLLRNAERELADAVGREQRAIAAASAESVARSLSSNVEQLARSAELIDWANATPEERKGALSLLYQQLPGATAVVLINVKEGVLAGPVSQEARSDASLATQLAAIPVATLQEGGKGQAAFSSAYVQDARMVMGIALKLEEGPEALFVLAEFAASSLKPSLARPKTSAVDRLILSDERGRVIASDGQEKPGEIMEDILGQRVSVAGRKLETSTVNDGRKELIVSVAALPGSWGFWSVARVDADSALRRVRAMRRTVLMSIGVALAGLLGLGLVFTRRINQRLERVVQGAEAFSQGNLSFRIPEAGEDELSDLARTFNRMGAELETSRARLLTWNDELRVRVEAATQDLREAQAQLLEAQKLAAVGQLGAGVAHEINNPLAGILGNTQILLMDRTASDPDFRSLQKIEQCAKRCKEITQSLLRFSQQPESPQLRPCDLNSVAREALSLSTSQSEQEGVATHTSLSSEPLIIEGDPGHLAQVVLALLSNARTAMLRSERRELKLRTAQTPEGAVLEVEDTGRGIPAESLNRIFEPFFTTKDIWSNVGLGLSVAYRTMTAHGGRIDVKTEVGKGTVFTLRFPKHVPSVEGVTASAPKPQVGAVGGMGTGIRG